MVEKGDKVAAPYSFDIVLVICDGEAAVFRSTLEKFGLELLRDEEEVSSREVVRF